MNSRNKQQNPRRTPGTRIIQNTDSVDGRKREVVISQMDACPKTMAVLSDQDKSR